MPMSLSWTLLSHLSPYKDNTPAPLDAVYALLQAAQEKVCGCCCVCVCVCVCVCEIHRVCGLLHHTWTALSHSQIMELADKEMEATESIVLATNRLSSGLRLLALLLRCALAFLHVSCLSVCLSVCLSKSAADRATAGCN
jgi:hypothetical protein